MNSINFHDLPMELWRLKRYEQNVILFEQIKPTGTNASISGYTGVLPGHNSGKDSGKASKTSEVIVYTEEDRMADGSDTSRELYVTMRDYIMSMDADITIKPTKLYVGFQLRNHNIIDIKIQKNAIVVWLNTEYGMIDDPRHMITDVTHVGHHGNGDCQIKITNKEHIGYIQDLIATFYHKNCSS